MKIVDTIDIVIKVKQNARSIRLTFSIITGYASPSLSITSSTSRISFLKFVQSLIMSTSNSYGTVVALIVCKSSGNIKMHLHKKMENKKNVLTRTFPLNNFVFTHLYSKSMQLRMKPMNGRSFSNENCSCMSAWVPTSVIDGLGGKAGCE